MAHLRQLLPFAVLVLAHACSPVSPVSLSRAPSLTPTPTPPHTSASVSAPEELSVTSPAYQLFAVVAQDAVEVIVRAGPGIDFLEVARLKAGEGAPVVGRTPQSDWWKLDLGGTRAWVYAAFVNIVGNPALVPIVPTPTIAPP